MSQLRPLAAGLAGLLAGSTQLAVADSYAPIALPTALPAGAARIFLPPGLQASGGVVRGWRDQVSGQVVATAGNPIYRAADADFNGLATVAVDSQNYFAGTFTIDTAGSLTVLIVAKDDSPPSSPLPLHSWLPMGVNGSMGYFTQAQNGQGLDWSGTSRYFSDGYDKRQMMLVAMSTASTDPAAVRLFRDGTELTPTTVSTTPLYSGSRDVYIGDVPGDRNYNWLGRYAAIVIYTRPLTPSELRQAQQYLRGLFALPVFVM